MDLEADKKTKMVALLDGLEGLGFSTRGLLDRAMRWAHLYIAFGYYTVEDPTHRTLVIEFVNGIESTTHRKLRHDIENGKSYAYGKYCS